MKQKENKKQKNLLLQEKPKIGKFVVLIVSMFLLIILIMQTGNSLNYQYSNPSAKTYYSTEEIKQYWPLIDAEKCYARQDFIVQIRPGGCTPAVVRSDLLEEQNVPVFCQIDALKINPLIEVQAIDRIVPVMGTGSSSGIQGVSYHPARAALRSYDTLLGSPIMNNIGYVVVVLSRQEDESKMPDTLKANLSAVIRYDISKAFGVGKTSYVLPQITDDLQWQADYKDYSFWDGRGYVRAENIDAESAKISVYANPDYVLGSFTLKKGETSQPIYFPGYYCMAGFEFKLEDLVFPEKRIKLFVNDDMLLLAEGERFELPRTTEDVGKQVVPECQVIKIDNTVNYGRADIRCKSKLISLKYVVKNTELLVNNEQRIFGLGDKVGSYTQTGKDGKQTNIDLYLAYSGSFYKDEETGRQKYALIVEKELKQKDIEKISAIASKLEKGSDKTINELIKHLQSALSSYEKVYGVSKDSDLKIIPTGSSEIKIEFFKISDKEMNSEVEENYDTAIKTYKDVADLYGEEVKTNENENYKTAALKAMAELSKEVGQDDKKNEYLTQLGKTEGKNYDYTAATDLVQFGSSIFTFRLGDVIVPTSDEMNANVVFDVPRKEASVLDLTKGESIGDEAVVRRINDVGYFFEVKDFGEKISYSEEDYGKIGQRYITLRYIYKDYSESDKTKLVLSSGQKRIYDGTSEFIGNSKVSINRIDLKREVKVKIVPKMYGTETQTNFNFNIAIEKRGIKLSPEKKSEMISNLNETIAKWETINKKLGEVVRVWKGTCLATSTFLIATNFFDNLWGRGIARQEVMRGPNGWYGKCEQMVASGDGGYTTVEACLAGESGNIEGEVKSLSEKVNQVDKNVQNIQNQAGVKSDDIFGINKVVSTDKFKEAYIKDLKARYSGDASIAGLDEKNVGYYSVEQLKKIDLTMRIKQDSKSSGFLKEYADKTLDPVLKDIGIRNSNLIAVNAIAAGLGKKSSDFTIETLIADGKYVPIRDSEKMTKDVQTRFTNPSVLQDNTPIKVVVYQGNEYLVSYKATSDSKKFYADKIYSLTSSGTGTDTKLVIGNEVTDKEIKNVIYKEAQVAVKAGECKNPYKNAKVRFFETEPYKGMPALVPFDTSNGWYAALKQDVPVFGKTSAYEASGRVTYFQLCNVGANGIEEYYSGLGDDVCSSINLDSDRNAHYCLQGAELSRKINDAVNAISQAADGYKSGRRQVNVLGSVYDIGDPAIALTGARCQDFMSPQDCLIMFNVCDPVMCPASRCNFGGTFPVQDVIQTGIAGGIALCLPNIREGIIVPVCLSGIHAGLEGYLSILKAHKACLEESLATGKTTGVCDEIYSIYLCEFFWRQFAPLANIAIPKLIEVMMGQGVRGGGEYLTVQDSWDRAEKSVEYFTQSYATSSFNAFTKRATDEAGTYVCKSFVSTRYPAGKSFFDALLEPDSPFQAHAWFSEMTMTEATIPATSQYKVYYHIYAGKDEGQAYTIYLREPPESKYYAELYEIVVDTGFIPKGDYVDITKDFTAPSGYKKLCIMVGMREECGFGKVSTDFALNYLSDLAVEKQAKERQITTEKGCISGSPSLVSVLQPNIQAGVEQIISNPVYEQGITRICSNKNPGEGFDSSLKTKRWVDVGYCGEEKIRCWLDTKSLADPDVFKSRVLANQTISDMQGLYYTDEKLRKEYGFLDRDESAAMVAKIKEDIDKAIKASGTERDELIEKINSDVAEVSRGSISNVYRAEALFLKAVLYGKLAVEKYQKLIAPEKEEILAKEERGPVLSEEEQDIAVEDNVLANVGSNGYINWKIENEFVRTNVYVDENNKLFINDKLIAADTLVGGISPAKKIVIIVGDYKTKTFSAGSSEVKFGELDGLYSEGSNLVKK